MAALTDVFRTLNELKSEEILYEYAITGAMAVLFYTEPARTYDLNAFVFLPPQTSTLFSMAPLYKDLRDRGYTFDAEHVMIHDTPVQFYPLTILSRKKPSHRQSYTNMKEKWYA